MVSPMVSSTAPTVNWVSPRMSALSMGFSGGSGGNNGPEPGRESIQSGTTWGFGEGRASRVSDLTTVDNGDGSANTYRDSRTTRASRYERYSRATRTSSYHSRFLAPPSPGDVPLPSPPPTWQVNQAGGMDSALWLSSRMTEHPGNPGSQQQR